MFFICKTSVCIFSAWRTFRCLHDWQVKKKAPVASCVACVICHFVISQRTQIDRAFSWTGLGSTFLKARYWQDRSPLSLSSLSQVGFGLSYSLKVDATNEMVFLVVLSSRESWIGPENLPECRAMAKAPIYGFVHSVQIHQERHPWWFQWICSSWSIVTTPGLAPLVFLHNCSFSGNLCSIEISQETILFSRGQILKFSGICERKNSWNMQISTLSLLSSSQEREPKIWLYHPGNHWEYSLICNCSNWVSWCLATSQQTAASSGLF